MFFSKFDFKIGKNWQKYFVSVAVYSVLFSATSVAISHEAKTQNSSLPNAPDTGTPEEDFQSAGTRDNQTATKACQADSQQIIYLLGNDIRESTLAAYPVFWFNFVNTKRNIARLEFVLEEFDTGNEVYSRTINTYQNSAIVGIPLPHKERYALVPNKNYSWSLYIDCIGEQQETLKLTGWLRRLLPNAELQNQLATASDREKYRVYKKHNLLYDALNELAQRRAREPNNLKVTTAWNQLLHELGWHNLIQQPAINFYVLQTDTEHN